MSDDLPASAPQRARWMVRLAANLSQWKRPTAHPRTLEPPVAAEELLSWSQDDGRWDSRANRDWRSLLDDVQASWSRLGPALASAVQVDEHLATLRGVRAASAIDADSHRSSVTDAAHALSGAFEAPAALRAAIDDLFAAATGNTHPDSLDDETEWRLTLLASVSEYRGHDWAVVAGRLRRALEHATDASVESSVNAVHRALSTPADRGRSIVWFAVDHAWAWGPSPNPAVQLINGDWLLAVLREWDGPREGVPAELAADPRRMVDAWPRFDETSDADEQLPVAFARVDLGEGPTVGARERARDTLELLIARASTLQGGTNWKIDGACLHFVDGELIYETSGPIGDPGIYDRLTRADILQDPTGTTINEEAQRLGAHIPVQSSQLHAALQLAQWLSEARGTPPPARLVLSGRIIEQAANWADTTVPALVTDHLAMAWAWTRIARDLSWAGAAAVLRLRGADGTSSDATERQIFIDVRRELIDDRHARGRPVARPWTVLPRLAWLIDQHSPSTEIGDYLRELQRRFADGPSATAWIDHVRDELRVRNARAVRCRNVIVHGGPLNAHVAKTAVGVQDELGSQALEWVIAALAAGRAVPDFFAERAADYNQAFERMRAGAAPADELQQAATSATAP